MNKLFLTAIFCLTILSVNAFAQSKTFFQTVAGNWEGTLEYLDYSENKRVKLKTYLMITPSADGHSAEIRTVYDDFGRIIKDTETYKIDLTAKTYSAGDFEYKIEAVEPIRETITFDENSLTFLKQQIINLLSGA